MGLPMDDIHTPSIASGPVTGPVTGQTGRDKPQKDVPLLELMGKKQQMEEELSALGSVLDSHGVTMSTTLTTFDGFPRDDIDVAQIRTTRARVIRLRNDYKGLMLKIEAGLHAHHASLRNASQRTSLDATSRLQSAELSETNSLGSLQAPFARVNSVVSGSPADEAGLRAGDRIRSFGTANYINHEKLSKVADIVQQSEGHTVLVKISREDQDSENGSKDIQLQLVPRRTWGGRGLLGCHLLPI